MPSKSLPTENFEPLLVEKVCADADDQTRVETFTFRVSPDEELTESASERSTQDVRNDGPDGDADWLASPTAEMTEKPTATPRRKRRSTKGATRKVAVPRATKKSRWTSAWFVSLVGHAICVFLVSLITVTAVDRLPEMTMAFSPAPQIPDEVNLDQISTDVLGEVSGDDVQLASAVGDASLESELTTDHGLVDFAGGVGDGPLGDGPPLSGMSGLMDATGLFGAGGGGTGGTTLGAGIPSGEKLTASFFGTKVDGRRILYVLDNSGGMQDGGLETLIEELLRSVESLSGEQEFYVIFYSDMVYPMFHPRGVERFVPANDRFKLRLKRWLDSVEFCVGNTVDEAIQAAAMIGPDAAYLLTDGNIDTTRDGRKMNALLDARGRDFPIHTFGIGMGESSKAAENLRYVAEANKGTFRVVEVTSEAKARAKQMNRPYHNKEPGRDWGLNVGRGWGR